MKQFVLKNPRADKRQTPDEVEQYGRSYWSETHDSDKILAFNLKGEEVKDGQTITAETVELAEFKSGENAGKEYLRLRKVRVQGQSATASTKDYQPKKEWRDDNHIRAQWAIGQAMSHFAQKDKVKLADVEALADALFEMVDRVKSGSNGAVTSQPRTKVEKPEPAADQEDIVVTDIGDEPINLDDIPF